MKASTRAALWIALYFLLVFAPLLLMVVGTRPAGRDFWRDFSVALGFVGLTLMGIQFIPVGRLRVLSDTFPMDAIYYFHHQMSVVSLAFVLVHPLVLIASNPKTLELLNVATAPRPAVFGIIAVVAALLLISLAVYRKEISLIYEVWRMSHSILAMVAIGAALLHIFGRNYYSGVPLQRLLLTCLALLWLAVLLYLRVLKPLANQGKPYSLTSVTPEPNQSYTLTVEPKGHSGLRFKPGQFAWIKLGSSAFDLREHPFSFASSSEHPEKLSFTVKELGDFTRTVKDIPCGSPVFLDGPYGTFGIDNIRSTSYVFLAGGVGITPLMSMLRSMADRGDKRPVILFYGSPSLETIVYREELDSLQKRMNVQVVHILERPPEGWQGEKGFITAKVLDKYLPKDRSVPRYLMCGPLPMIEAVERALVKAGVPYDHVHSERYEMA
jgi:predicted ferric reductase